MITSGGWERPLPTPSSVSRPFWEATRAGRFMLQRCTRCGEYVWTPQLACRRCLTETLEWTEASGRGTVHSYSVIHRAATPAFATPYTIVVVSLDEGPHMLSDLIGVAPDAVRIGMPVEVAIELTHGVGLYHFRPCAEPPAGEHAGGSEAPPA